jgi:hypothetical protein
MPAPNHPFADGTTLCNVPVLAARSGHTLGYEQRHEDHLDRAAGFAFGVLRRRVREVALREGCHEIPRSAHSPLQVAAGGRRASDAFRRALDWLPFADSVGVCLGEDFDTRMSTQVVTRRTDARMRVAPSRVRSDLPLAHMGFPSGRPRRPWRRAQARPARSWQYPVEMRSSKPPAGPGGDAGPCDPQSERRTRYFSAPGAKAAFKIAASLRPARWSRSRTTGSNVLG